MILKETTSQNRSRKLVVKFIEKQLAYNSNTSVSKGHCWHYGKEAIRQLLDYVYKGKPRGKGEYLLSDNIRNLERKIEKKGEYRNGKKN